MGNETFNSEARLSWVLAALAGVVGAISFTHSAGYFVVFVTGNAQRAVLGYFTDEVWLAASAGLLIVAFVAGVVVASLCRRFFWVDHPHGPTVLTTFSLLAATVVDLFSEGWQANLLDFAPIVLMAFGTGALNTSFVKDGEVSVPLSYVTGTTVKMGQGIERHMAGGGSASDWLGYFLLLASFMVGATVGGFISVVVNGTWMLVIATVVCALTTAYTYFHQDRRALLLEAESAKKQRQKR
ncbi:DUF1275 domain-containing protein [Mycobacterium sp. SMC-2]|uniref:YoaK family protein n=1 Tax=Mycobacterium sp. SMC-2 TaxID=2857058 RepID=UPI0021B1B32C|nr:YoaK family protein [Mycobacterium sp. SMC-2]UXA07353.1 DUF1275 domain-containing protein [Mycobacterium sp. SMC-2]